MRSIPGPDYRVRSVGKASPTVVGRVGRERPGLEIVVFEINRLHEALKVERNKREEAFKGLNRGKEKIQVPYTSHKITL